MLELLTAWCDVAAELQEYGTINGVPKTKEAKRRAGISPRRRRGNRFFDSLKELQKSLEDPGH